MDTTTTMRGAADAAPGETDSAARHPAPLRPSGSRPPGPRGSWLGLSLLGDMRRDYLGFATARQRRATCPRTRGSPARTMRMAS